MFFIFDPEFWAWATAWTRDPVVLDWIRTELEPLRWLGR